MKWLTQLTDKLTKTRENFFGKVKDLFRRGDITESLWEELEELLIEADVGINTTDLLISKLRETVKENGLKDSWKLFEVFKETLAEFLGEQTSPIRYAATAPTVVLVVGVNGTGKTTSIGKLSHWFKSQGKKVFLGAADTFRAAAIDQLEVWTDRSGVEIIKHREGADPGAVAYDAIKASQARHADVLIIDTAGRLHTKSNLMDELKKIRHVVQKEIPEAPHETLLVIDAATGQNALNQAKMFKEAVDVSGVILTKLDGSAKGGALIGIRQELGLPIKFIGVGEKMEDLQVFDPKEFAAALLE